MRFEGERGERFFRSTLIQTLFYGIFSAWVLWSREEKNSDDPLFAGRYNPARFNWRESVWHLRAPVLRALFQQLSDPGRLKPLGLVEVLDWTAAALDRVDRALKDDLSIPDGLAAENVYVLDPCCGTGAYLAEVLRRIAANLEEQGPSVRSPAWR